MERVTGIEPAFSAWEADVLPLNYTRRTSLHLIATPPTHSTRVRPALLRRRRPSRLPSRLVTTRVLVIGLDAADPGVLERLVADGRAPTIARLQREGATADLASPLRTLPGAIWPELATGVSGGRSALYYHPRQLRTGEAVARPITAAEVDAEAQYWVVATAGGCRSLTVDVPQSVATTAEVGGTQLFEWGLHDRNFAITSQPPELLDRIRSRHGDHPVAVCDSAHGSTVPGYRRLLRGLCDGMDTKTEFASELVEGNDWDLATVVFAEGHCAGHQLFHFHDPMHRFHDAAAPADLRGGITDVYRRLDSAVARLIDAAGPDAEVLVVASHGMASYVGGYQLLAPVLDALGYGPQHPRPTKPPKSALPLRRLARRVLPTGVRDRRDAARRADPATYTRVVFTDPSQRAAVLDNNRCGAIRLNVEGREPEGTVAPSDVASTLEALRRQLAVLVDPASGEPIVAATQTALEAFGPDHHPDLPDLLVDFRTDLGPLETCTSPATGEIHRTFLSAHTPRSGDHVPGSRLWATGRGFLPGTVIDGANVLDLAPTVLDLLEVPVPGSVDGRSLLVPDRGRADDAVPAP